MGDFKLTLSDKLEKTVEELSSNLGIPKNEWIRQAITRRVEDSNEV